MGKYAPSKLIKSTPLQNTYSDWHYQSKLFNRTAYLTDIDRLWVEIRNGNLEESKPVAIFDIKEPEAIATLAQKVAYDWFEAHGLPVFIVITTIEMNNFEVVRWKSGKTVRYDGKGYSTFINSLPGSVFL